MRTLRLPGICTLSRELQGESVLTTPGNAPWPAANDALFLPLTLSRPVVVKRMVMANGNVAGNNFDMGIYSSGGSLLTSIGSTAQSGTNANQMVSLPAPIYLPPGRYYVAGAFNGTTGTVRRMTLSVIRLQQMGVLKMTTAFPLPTTATFATVTSTLCPVFGLDLGGIL